MINTQSFLNSFTNFELRLHQIGNADFDLSGVRKLLDLLGNPQKQLKIIHVAGTKGKGSTCAFLAYILAMAGYKTGLFTSPHLHQINERIRILEKSQVQSAADFAGAISDDQMAEGIAFIQPAIEDLQKEGIALTYFEVLTVLALCFFVREKTDVVILETGLGGRLDATNASDAMIALITPVSLDHTKILGSTLAQIAAEKAGIIKHAAQKVVIAPQSPQAMAVILNRCQEFDIVPMMADLHKAQGLPVSLAGSHQKLNAACAVSVVELLRGLGYAIAQSAVIEGLKNTRWPGRCELLQENPVVIADGAHNVASAQALGKAVRELYPNRNIILVLGLSSDKDIDGICAEFKIWAQAIILTKADHPRAHVFTAAQAQQLFQGHTWKITEHVHEALDMALAQAKKDDVIIAAGSIFVAAEARIKIKEYRFSG